MLTASISRSAKAVLGLSLGLLCAVSSAAVLKSSSAPLLGSEPAAEEAAPLLVAYDE